MVNHDRSTITSTPPVFMVANRVMIATPQQETHPLQPQPLRYHNMSSEPSSVNSTRNTSPVSLVSSSVYSGASSVSSSAADENRNRSSSNNRLVIMTLTNI